VLWSGYAPRAQALERAPRSSPISPIYLPYISRISPVYLSYISPTSPVCLQALEQALRSSKSARGVPFVACHGDADDKVKPECGARLVATLRAAGVLVHAHKVFEGLKHGCTREQIEQLAALLRQVAPKQGERGDGAGKAAAKPDATNKKRD
jgi:hypothetical protein